MIFCRHVGLKGDGFTQGKVYPARPEVNGAETVGFDFIEIVNDMGEPCRHNPKTGGFEYLSEVYTVVVKPVPKRKVGEVVVVDGMSEDMAFMSIRGSGFFSSSSMAFLDRTNVFPGMVVMDTLTGYWVPVRRIDECLWITVNGGKLMRSPEEFRFAVADNEILTEPIARCLDSTGLSGLTQGTLYRVQRIWNGLWTIKGDNGVSVECDPERFLMGS